MLFGYFVFLILLLMIPFTIISTAVSRHPNWESAAFNSVFCTLLLSIRLIVLHLTHWHMPDVQKYVVRILWMVPLYSIQSWLSLRFHEARLYIDTLRNLYEAYVICSFVYYLIALLGGQNAMVEMLERKRDMHLHHLGEHTFPLNLFFPPWSLGREFMLQCKHGVLQYVVARTVTTLLTLFLEPLELYGEGKFNWNVAYPYMTCALNASVMYALYCLVKLFHAVHYELRHWSPLGKFLCIKGVVFFTWWQGVLIYFLKAHGWIRDIRSWNLTASDVANGLIDYCVCVEMVLFAVAHMYAFPYTEYLPPEEEVQYQGDDISQDGQQQRQSTSLTQQAWQDNSSLGEHSATVPSVMSPSQQPRALQRPMRFKDAFWSSTVPEETLQDIHRLRQGVSRVVSQASCPGEVSLTATSKTFPEGENDLGTN